jgi:hypothetical protein
MGNIYTYICGGGDLRVSPAVKSPPPSHSHYSGEIFVNRVGWKNGSEIQGDSFNS